MAPRGFLKNRVGQTVPKALLVVLAGLPPPRGRHHAPCSGRLPEGTQQFFVCRKLTGRLLGISEPAVHRDLEDAAARPSQAHLRGGLGLKNRIPRRTGAWFIASHAAVFDFDLHGVALPEIGHRARVAGNWALRKPPEDA